MVGVDAVSCIHGLMTMFIHFARNRERTVATWSSYLPAIRYFCHALAAGSHPPSYLHMSVFIIFITNFSNKRTLKHANSVYAFESNENIIQNAYKSSLSL